MTKNLLDLIFETYDKHVLAIKDKEQFVNSLAREITLKLNDKLIAYIIQTWVRRHVKREFRETTFNEIFTRLKLELPEQEKTKVMDLLYP